MKIKKHIVYKDFAKMFELEKAYYNEEFITSVEESFKWYKYRSDSFLCVEEEGEVIGFMCLFPIKNSIYNEIKRGKFNDSSLKYEDIYDKDELKSGAGYNLFLSCVVVSREYRGSQVLNLLLNGYKNLYSEKVDNSIRFNQVIMDVVTSDGQAFAESLGFKNICSSEHNSNIYEIEYDDFIKSIRK